MSSMIMVAKSIHPEPTALMSAYSKRCFKIATGISSNGHEGEYGPLYPRLQFDPER